MKSATPVDHDPFASGAIVLSAPVTEPQQEIWLAIALLGEEANLAYNESVSLAIRGPLEADVLEQAVADLVRRHEALRTTFTSDGTTYLVEAEPRAKLTVVDLGSLDPAAREARRKKILAEQVRVPFDLVRGPLFRPLLIRLASEQHELVLTAHHIVCDGWSTGVVLTELPELYAARNEGRPAKLAKAPLFSDFAVTELRGMHGEDAAEAEKYWLSVLGTAPSSLELPVDNPRSRELKLDARREDWLLDSGARRRLAWGGEAGLGHPGGDAHGRGRCVAVSPDRPNRFRHGPARRRTGRGGDAWAGRALREHVAASGDPRSGDRLCRPRSRAEAPNRRGRGAPAAVLRCPAQEAGDPARPGQDSAYPRGIQPGSADARRSLRRCNRFVRQQPTRLRAVRAVLQRHRDGRRLGARRRPTTRAFSSIGRFCAGCAS